MKWKELFSAASGLPGEYLLCDRRFTADDARAGFNAEFNAETGKEILLLAKKT